jgi:hypothetical protein
MKKILLGVLLIMFIFTSAQAVVQKEEAAAKKADGNEWVTWDDTRKQSFVEGFLAGSFYMIEEGVTLTRGHSGENEEKLNEMAVKIDAERDNPVFTGADLASWSEMEKEYLVKERNRTLMKYLVRGVSNAQLKEGLDSIYADATIRQIAISDAIYLAKMKAFHAEKDEIDSVLQYLREGKKNPKRLKIENEKGELVKFIQFP